MEHAEARADLAAAFRWTVRCDMHDGIANHFSLAVSEDGRQFLINPYGIHWSILRASDLLLLDAASEPEGLGDRVDRTAWAIHGALHRVAPQARCVMHVHSRFATALSALADPTLPPVDQTTMRFFNRVAIDTGYDGMGLGDEAKRLARCLGNHRMMMMGQHGILAAAPTVGQCFDLIYSFEKGAETYLRALWTGRPLAVASEAVAEKTARQWEAEPAAGDRHLAAIRGVLDREATDYAA
jgi:ribulose-5-phosphate 4-epimerase/fuculose-1-phosphate aldolase